MTKGFFALCLAGGVLAGCAGGSGGPGATTAPRLHNPLDFPLYPSATLISVKPFTEIVSAGTSGDSPFAQGNGKYSGHEVIASSAASFDALSAWVEHLNASPPGGYTALESGTNPQQQEQSQQYGFDYAAFKRKAAGRTRGVLVIVMDPQRLNKKFGAILGMISRYRALPSILRSPIDVQAKTRFGMTITQATQPDSPVGAALAALSELQHSDARGIVVLDAQKQ